MKCLRCSDVLDTDPYSTYRCYNCGAYYLEIVIEDGIIYKSICIDLGEDDELGIEFYDADLNCSASDMFRCTVYKQEDEGNEAIADLRLPINITYERLQTILLLC